MSRAVEEFIAELERPTDTEQHQHDVGACDFSFIEHATDEEIDEALSALCNVDVSGNPRAQSLVETFLQNLLRHANCVSHETPSCERMSLLYRHLGRDVPARAVLLRFLASRQSEEASRAFCELLVTDPPDDSASASIGFAPFFQSRSAQIASLFPRLFDAIEHLAVASLVIDLANFATRQCIVTEHPGVAKRETLFALLGHVAQRLEHLEETANEGGEDENKIQKKIAESVSMTVSLCDAAALIGHQNAIPKLNQAINLKHRRIRTEAAAALATLGDEEGKDVLLTMASEPVARLRVLAYAEELELLEEIDEQYRSESAVAEAELAAWLAEPTQMGLPPTKLDLIDSQTQYWPSYEEPRTCYLFRFTYQLGGGEYSNVGIVGPLTHAFDVDLQDLSPADIYAIFAGWQTEHEEILEFAVDGLTPPQRTHVDRLLTRLPADEITEIAPVTLGSFFGELTLVCGCVRDHTDAFAIIDAEQTTFIPAGVGRRPLRAEHAYWLYKGRRILQSFN